MIASFRLHVPKGMGQSWSSKSFMGLLLQPRDGSQCFGLGESVCVCVFEWIPLGALSVNLSYRSVLAWSIGPKTLLQSGLLLRVLTEALVRDAWRQKLRSMLFYYLHSVHSWAHLGAS